MKSWTKSIPVRIVTALGGLALLAAAGVVVAEGFFGLPLTAAVTLFLGADSALAVLLKILAALVLTVLAVCCVVSVLPTRPAKQADSIMQKGEHGTFGITVASIKKMVLACAAKHPEIIHADVDVREVRDGIIILMNVQQVGGVSIPLSIDRLQKQVRQYVRGRTGLDVPEVRVMVDNVDDNHVASEYEVEDTVMPSGPVHAEEFIPVSAPAPAEPLVEKLAQIAEITQQPLVDDEPEAEPETEASVLPTSEELDLLLPVAEAAPEMVLEDERPLHQRVFGAEEMPQMVPMPPEMTVQPPVPEELPEAPAEEPRADASPVAEEAPAEEVPTEELAPAEAVWTDPSLQAAADAVLTADLTAPLEAAAEAAEEPSTEKKEEPEALL